MTPVGCLRGDDGWVALYGFSKQKHRFGGLGGQFEQYFIGGREGLSTSPVTAGVRRGSWRAYSCSSWAPCAPPGGGVPGGIPAPSNLMSHVWNQTL